jgi:hypothetical protein
VNTQVMLERTNGAKVFTTKTDQNGHFFLVVGPGEYYVERAVNCASPNGCVHLFFDTGPIPVVVAAGKHIDLFLVRHGGAAQ